MLTLGAALCRDPRSRAAIARASGFDPSQVGRWAGGSSIRQALLGRLCDELDLSSSDRDEVFVSCGWVPPDVEVILRSQVELLSLVRLLRGKHSAVLALIDRLESQL
jgi:hypothetical protein